MRHLDEADVCSWAITLRPTPRWTKFPPELRANPSVLKFRWGIYVAAEKWSASLDIARALTTKAPKDGKHWKRMAISHCKTGDVQSARECLEKAFRLDPDLRQPALNDGRLKPVWVEEQSKQATSWPWRLCPWA